MLHIDLDLIRWQKSKTIINKEISLLQQKIEMLKIDQQESLQRYVNRCHTVFRAEAQKKIYESIIFAYESAEKDNLKYSSVLKSSPI